MIPAFVIHRLAREASKHLSDPNSPKSLRELCRRFLDQNKIPPKAYV